MKYKKLLRVLLVLCLVLTTSSIGFGGEVYQLYAAAPTDLSNVEKGLDQPYGLDFDQNGALYIADTYNNMIKKFENGVLSVVAGSYAGKNSLGFPLGGLVDGEALEAQFNKPRDVLVTDDGVIYVADTYNHVIRRIENGIVKTFSGTGKEGDSVGSASVSAYNLPTAIAMDASGSLYVADTLNDKIKVLDSKGASKVLTLTSNGKAVTLNEPSDLFFDASGALYILDSGNQNIKKVVDGNVEIIAGTSSEVLDEDGYAFQGYFDGLASYARFNFPKGIVADGLGYLYIADAWNNMIRVLKPDGYVTTLSGSIYPGNALGSLSEAAFFTPAALAYASGNLYVSDRWNNDIKVISLNYEDAALRLNPNYLLTFVNQSQLSSTAYTVWFDGGLVTLEVPVWVNSEQPLVPLKSVARALGYMTSWDEGSRSVVLTKNGQGISVTEQIGMKLKEGKSFVGLDTLNTLFGINAQYDTSSQIIVILQ